ncbi:hypothetical protein [Streptomyces sp. NPDC093109]|uniref:hypothetical protein n=1 Tax=Streptomyces sp. NPDC093109 TaxID=3154977 RepID=UPI00344F7AB9
MQTIPEPGTAESTTESATESTSQRPLRYGALAGLALLPVVTLFGIVFMLTRSIGPGGDGMSGRFIMQGLWTMGLSFFVGVVAASPEKSLAATPRRWTLVAQYGLMALGLVLICEHWSR